MPYRNQRVRTLSMLPNNWDAAGSNAPTQEALDMADLILDDERFAPVVFKSVPTRFGGINLEYHLHEDWFEVSIEPTGELQAWWHLDSVVKNSQTETSISAIATCAQKWLGAGAR